MSDCQNPKDLALIPRLAALAEMVMIAGAVRPGGTLGHGLLALRLFESASA